MRVIIHPDEHRSEMLDKVARSLLPYVCPLYRMSKKQSPEIAGTAIPFQTLGRQFLITAAHVIDFSGFDLAYPSHDSTLISNIIKVLKTNENDEKGEFAFLEIKPGTLDSYYEFVPHKTMNVDTDPLQAEKIVIVGFPYTRNKPRYRATTVISKLQWYSGELSNEETYRKLDISLDLHWSIDYKKASVRKGPLMNGVSGGPVWSFDRRALLEGTNENVKLIGIVNEKDALIKAIWGPRMALIMESMALEIPELSKAVPRPNDLVLRSYLEQNGI